MKKLILALIVAVSALTVSDAFAFGRKCGTNACETNNCAAPCQKSCAKYRVIDETCECPPECERFVRVTEPAICIRSCRWVCPEGTSMTGGNVNGQFELVGGRQVHGN